jgi:hypothetical protein
VAGAPSFAQENDLFLANESGMIAAAFAVAATLSSQPIDEDYTRLIREYTTEPFFLTEMVDHLPLAPGIPTPKDHLGYIVGAPNVLTPYAKSLAYFKRIADASPRVKYERMGTSEEGRELGVVFISDEVNLARLDRIKQVNNLLADPRKISADEAQALIDEALPIYWLTAGMHCTETGPPEMVIELLYRLAAAENPMIENIRKNAIVMITPALDPDGRDRVVDIYNYRKANPDKPVPPLVYWGKYVSHDCNRDGMMLTLELSKAVTRKWLEYTPQVFHDLHESVPYLYVSTGTGPYNPWLDPIVIDEWHELAYAEVGEMTRRGVPGVWTHGFYDGWAANYGFTVAHGHNAIGRFYETFSGGGADTGVRSAGNTERVWYRPNPPFPNVRWSIRNNTNLMQSGALIALNKVATDRKKYMENFYLKSLRSTQKPWQEGPAAYVIEARENRTAQLRILMETMLRQGIELHQLDEDIIVAEKEYKRGTVIVRMDQPYSRFVDMMLDRQYYNPTDPRSYDDTGWQLGPLFDLNVTRVKDNEILDKEMSRANIPTTNFETQNLARIAVVHTWQSTQDEGWVRIAFDMIGVPYTYTSVHELRDNANLRAKYDVIILPQARGTAQSIVNGIPKIGEPIPWKSMPGLESLGGPDSTDDIRGGIELEGVLNLRNFAQQGGTIIAIGRMCTVMIDYGIVSGVTVAQTQTLQAPGGVYLTQKLAQESDVLEGYESNVAVYFNANSLPILSTGGGGGRGGAQATRPSGRGSITDADVVQGRAQYTAQREEGDTDRGGATTPQAPRPNVLLRFANANQLLVSGMLANPEELAGQAALVECKVGEGRVLLFAFNPFWRAMSVGSYQMVLNAAKK